MSEEEGGVCGGRVEGDREGDGEGDEERDFLSRPFPGQGQVLQLIRLLPHSPSQERLVRAWSSLMIPNQSTSLNIYLTRISFTLWLRKQIGAFVVIIINTECESTFFTFIKITN